LVLKLKKKTIEKKIILIYSATIWEIIKYIVTGMKIIFESYIFIRVSSTIPDMLNNSPFKWRVYACTFVFIINIQGTNVAS
jgi:hypothetical protein